MPEFKERLDEAMRIRDISAAELSRISKVNEGAISQYRAGKYKASQRSLDKLARALNVSIPWLMGADVPMTDDPSAPPLPSPAITKSLIHNLPTAPQLLPDERQLLSDYRNFNDEGQEKVRDYVEDLKDSPKYKKCSAPCMEKQA